MARTPSIMLPLGTEAPDFSLPDTTQGGAVVSRDDFAGTPGLLVVFLCNHCPFVHHVRHQLAELTRRLMERGLAVVGVSSNYVGTHPQDGPEQMAREAQEIGYPFPYLYDESQAVAKAYRAACTPDFFLFDGDLRLVYRGQFDDSRPGNGAPVTGADLAAACEAVLDGEEVPAEQKPSIGCNIKWKPGAEPDYFG